MNMERSIRHLKVSDLARAYVGWATDLEWRKYAQDNSPGTRMHNELKRITPANLQSLLSKFFSRRTGNMVVTGVIDGVRLVGKKVSLVEFKTIEEDKFSDTLVEMSSFQLQLYIWICEKVLKLFKKHYLEFYSRATGKLVARFEVHRDPKIELKIWFTVAKCYGETTSDTKQVEVK